MFLLFYRFGALPIEPYRCGANINGSLYNVSDIAAKNTVYTYEDEFANYYIRLCDDLTPDMVPSHAKMPFGVNGIRINKHSNFTESIAFHDTQTYDYHTSEDPNLGFVIKTSAQATDPESKYRYYEVVFDFTNEEMENEDMWNVMTYEDEDKLVVVVMYFTDKAVPKQVEPPPDPILPPTCKHIYDSQKVYPYGIDLNLYKLNYGAHGIPVQLDGDLDTLILYQPCSFSNCPTDFNCGKFVRSAAWVCKRDTMSCEGFSNPRVQFNMLYEDPDEGYRIVYQPQDDNQLIVDMTCNFELSEHEMWVQNAQLKNDSHLNIRLTSKDACMQPLIQPSPEQCRKNLTDSKYTLDIDITKYNVEDGTVFNVTNSAWPQSQRHWIVSQPCGPLPCPGDICPDSTGATIWLCWDNIDGTVECDDFGLYRNLVDIEPFFGPSLSNGVALKYDGTNTSATIRMICDWQQEPNTIKYRPEIFFEDDERTVMSISATSRDVCVGKPPYSPTPAPTTKPPAPAWTPLPPQPTKSPTPVLDTSRSYVGDNDTHVISFNIDELSFSSEDLLIDWNDHSIKASAYCKPFHRLSCPSGFQCFGKSTSDFWLCWDKKCYSMMDVENQGLDRSILSSMSGAHLSGYGYYDTKVEFDVKCDKNQKEPMVHTMIAYDNAHTYSITLNWANACPHDIVEPVFPDPPISPTPQPAKPHKIAIDNSNGYFDLSKVSAVQKQVRIKGKGTELADFIFDPSHVNNCPQNANCNGVKEASSWKCWTNSTGKYCLAVSDIRYDVQIDKNSINYTGGYGGYSLKAAGICDKSVPDNSIILKEEMTEKDKEIKADVLGRMFCQGYQKPVTGGIIVFTVLVLIVSAYFVFGVVFNFVSRGEVRLPHAEFWRLIRGYIRQGLSFITCNKLFKSDATSAYDAI